MTFIKLASGNINRYERRNMEQDLLDIKGYNFRQEIDRHIPRTLLTDIAESKVAKNRNYHPPLRKRFNHRGTQSVDGNFASMKQHGAQSFNDNFSSTQAETGDQTEPYPPQNWNGLLTVDVSHSSSSFLNTSGNYANSSLGTESAIRQLGRERLKPNVVTISPMLRTSKVSSRSMDISASRNRWVQQQLEQEEEELKYYTFVHEVTQDILDRGVYSDRVLKTVFAHHLERKKKDLNVNRMQHLLMKLLDDLGVPKEGFFTSYANGAAHPENVHHHIGQISGQQETPKEWWPGETLKQLTINDTSDFTEKEAKHDTHEELNPFLDTSKMFEKSFKSRIHRKDTNFTPSPKTGIVEDDEESVDISFTEDEIDDIINDRNIPKLLKKVDQATKPKNVSVTVEVNEYEEDIMTSDRSSAKHNSDDNEEDVYSHDEQSEEGEGDGSEEEKDLVNSPSHSSLSSPNPSEKSYREQSSVSLSLINEQFEEDFNSEHNLTQRSVHEDHNRNSPMDDEQDSEELLGKEDLKEAVPGPETPKNTAVIKYWSSREDGSFDLKGPIPDPYYSSEDDFIDSQISSSMRHHADKTEEKQGFELADRQGSLSDNEDEKRFPLPQAKRQDTWTKDDDHNETSKCPPDSGRSPLVIESQIVNRTCSSIKNSVKEDNNVNMSLENNQNQVNGDITDEVRLKRASFLEKLDTSKAATLPLPESTVEIENQQMDVAHTTDAYATSEDRAIGQYSRINNLAIETAEEIEEDNIEDHLVESRCTTEELSDEANEIEDDIPDSHYNEDHDRSIRPLEAQDHPEFPPLSPIQEVPETPLNRSTAKQNWQHSIRELELDSDDESVESAKLENNIEKLELNDPIHINEVTSHKKEPEMVPFNDLPVPAPRRRSKEWTKG